MNGIDDAVGIATHRAELVLSRQAGQVGRPLPLWPTRPRSPRHPIALPTRAGVNGGHVKQPAVAADGTYDLPVRIQVQRGQTVFGSAGLGFESQQYGAVRLDANGSMAGDLTLRHVSV